MPITIADELLLEAGMNEGEARIEIACRLFEAGKLSLPAAGRWAALSRTEIEQELMQRKISLYRPTIDDVSSDLTNLNRLGV
ncbi:MAG: UPF0175 family protein [Planctomycetota bacterium]|nr:UPF0175 family protein [Planctomycetota bacterium]MDA1137496.1 UPF0175 family protein [Planctomycetota bacterium]